MKWNNILLTAYLLFVFCCFSEGVFAQTKENSVKELLLGKWKWESASIVDDKNPVVFDFINGFYKFYAEVEVRENTVSLKNANEDTEEVGYKANDTVFVLTLPSGKSFTAEWTVINEKLYLKFDSTHIYDASKKVKVLLVYKRY